MTFLGQVRRGMMAVGGIFSAVLSNGWYCYSYRNLRNKPKIIYVLTPPPRLKNIGDHAQALAIRDWLASHFSHLPVIEMDKDQSQRLLPALRWLTRPEDVIFLHSGGNMNERSMWSEGIRRSLITAFRKNQIISLPQTIHFSDTPAGRQEQENTCRIYGSHPNLTIMGRDPRSTEIAEKMFPNAQIHSMPDFVLSLAPKPPGARNYPYKVLLCLRKDVESALTDAQRVEIARESPYPCTYFDTTLPTPIPVGDRQSILDRTLEQFAMHDVVVTDRYHGLIFAVLCGKPCVVLSTVDHKLISAMHWFKDVKFVAYAERLDEVPMLVETCLNVKSRNTPNWNERYFEVDWVI